MEDLSKNVSLALIPEVITGARNTFFVLKIFCSTLPVSIINIYFYLLIATGGLLWRILLNFSGLP
jgi:hypothetical protein